MLLLFETAGGFALFKVLDEGKLIQVEDLDEEFASPESARKMVKLTAFDNTSEALEAGAPSKGLLKFLEANCQGEALVDDMIIEAIGLLNDLDKELNTCAMRFRKQYGRHFPELSGIIKENLLYAKSVKLMGNRINGANIDFSQILEDEIEAQLQEAAVISTGTEVSDLDLKHIRELCDQVVFLTEKRAQLHDDLKSRMNTVAPNLTALVGELVGARLISCVGGLLNLAKQPGSTIQLLGANEAPFRAFKKAGFIYHAPVVGQLAPKLKGQILRSLAAKAALAIRCDALGDGKVNKLGLENRAKLEERLRKLEKKNLGRRSRSAKGKSKIEVYDEDKKMGSGGLITPAETYNSEAEEEEEPEEVESSKKNRKKTEAVDLEEYVSVASP